MILRLLNWQGVAGIAASLAIALLLVIQKSETSHWKKQSASFELLYRQEQGAFATTVADYRAAADRARAADQANAERVAAEQAAINERTSNDFEVRIAAARADARRLQLDAHAAADCSRRRRRPMSSIRSTDRDRAGNSARRADQVGAPPAFGGPECKWRSTAAGCRTASSS